MIKKHMKKYLHFNNCINQFLIIYYMEYITWTVISVSTLSLILSLLFMFHIACNKASLKKLYLKLIFMIQTSDAIFAVGLILLMLPQQPEFEKTCYLHAFFIIFGALNSTFSRLAVMIVMYMALKQKSGSFTFLGTKVFIMVTVFSLLFSAV